MHLSQHVISECTLQHRILGLVNGNTLRQPVALPLQFGICDHQDAPAEDRKDASHLMPRPLTAQQIAALLWHFLWECLDNPMYSPDFTLNAVT